MIDINGRRIIIYGVGYPGECYYYSLCEQNKCATVKGVVDTYASGLFHGFTIGNDITEIFEKGDLIVVSTLKKTYSEIKKTLKMKELTEFEDFIWYGFLGKKLITINSNCYGHSIVSHLEYLPAFNDIYAVIPTPLIHENPDKEIPIEQLKATDVFIYQPVKTDNAFDYRLSDEYLLSNLRDDCITICIPNLVFRLPFLWPTFSERIYLNNRHILYKDSLADEAYEKTKGETQRIAAISKYIDDYEFDYGSLSLMFDKSVEELRTAEQKWDIKLIDQFDMTNKKEFPDLMWDLDHPQIPIMKHICFETAKLLGIENSVILPDSCYSRKMLTKLPIYRQIRDYFGIKNYEEVFSDLFTGKTCGLEGYLRDYVFYRYGEYYSN